MELKFKEDRKNCVYVAGPMTGYVDHNFPAFNNAAAKLEFMGWTVFNPAENGYDPRATWADYMHLDIKMLTECEAIALLPNWEKSPGAHLEVSIAIALGMRIITIDDAVEPNREDFKWLKPKEHVNDKL